MTVYTDEERRAEAVELLFRRRALLVNGGIYARRHAPHLLPLLVGASTLRARYIGQIGWLKTQQEWRAEDGRRLFAIADEIARLGQFRSDIAATCQWHAERIRELVRQHYAAARLGEKHRCAATWPSARGRPAAFRRRRALVRGATRDLQA